MMSHTKIPFTDMPWEAGAHPLERKKSFPERSITVLEFGPGFVDPNWCVRGHVGYVISGTLRLEYEGASCTVTGGDAFAIDPGVRHRASNPGTDPVRLFIVSRDPA